MLILGSKTLLFPPYNRKKPILSGSSNYPEHANNGCNGYGCCVASDISCCKNITAICWSSPHTIHS